MSCDCAADAATRYASAKRTTLASGVWRRATMRQLTICSTPTLYVRALTSYLVPSVALPSPAPRPALRSLLLTATGRAGLEHVKRALNAVGGGNLAGRIFLKGCEELPHNHGARHQGPKLVAPPAGIHHRFCLIALPGILSKIGHERHIGLFFRSRKQIALDGL